MFCRDRAAGEVSFYHTCPVISVTDSPLHRVPKLSSCLPPPEAVRAFFDNFRIDQSDPDP